MDEPILECKNLSKSYENGRFVFRDFSLALPAGKIIGLLGPNGSGKTTLIKLSAGLLTPSAGQILIAGNVPGPESKAIVSYLPERNAIPEALTVEGAMDLYAEMFADFDYSAAVRMLTELRVDPAQKIKSLSKGTKEKVQLILVMSRKARLYLLDEPIGGVDPAARDYILQTVIRNRNPEATVLISTHLIADVEPYLDEFLFLMGGRVIRSGNAADYREAVGMTLDESFRREFKC